MAHEIFVSYSKSDRDCAFEITARLEAHGLSVWIAPRDVSPSADWAEEIVDAISAARVMVLVFSTESNCSPQVRREVERAVYRQLAILPFRIDDVLPSKSLEYFLSSQHWLDAFPVPQEAHYTQLCHTLSAILRKPDVRAPGASLPAVDPHLEDSFRAMGQHGVFEALDLNHLVTHLAEHIGPMARILVRRAAIKAHTMAELKQLLANELETEESRQQFLAAVRGLGIQP